MSATTCSRASSTAFSACHPNTWLRLAALPKFCVKYGIIASRTRGSTGVVEWLSMKMGSFKAILPSVNPGDEDRLVHRLVPVVVAAAALARLMHRLARLTAVEIRERRHQLVLELAQLVELLACFVQTLAKDLADLTH